MSANPRTPSAAAPVAARPLPAVHRALPGVFYGWVVVGGTALVAFVCVGIGFYSQAVLLDGLVGTRGWPRETVSAASSLFFLTGGIAGSVIGRAIDRSGARGWIVAGAFLMAGALLALGRAGSASSVWVLYPLMAVGFAMCTSVPNNALITRWFVALRTRAMSVSQTGVSAGGIVIVPWATWLISTHGLETATRWLALCVVAVAVPVTVFVLRWDPADHGLEPDGSLEHARSNPRISLAAQARVWKARHAMRTRAFWLLAFAFGLVLFSQVGFLVHELAYLRPLLGERAASFAVSTTAAGSIVGRLLVGFFADRFELRRVAVVLFVVQASAILSFSLVHDPRALYAAAFLMGMTIGNIFMFQSLLTSELFGIPSFGTVFGSLQLVTQVMSSSGPFAVGWMSVALGGYPSAYRVLVCLALAGALIVSTVHPPPEEDALAPQARTPQGRTV